MSKFKIGDRVRDNGRGYPVQNGSKVGVVTGYWGKSRPEVKFPTRYATFPYLGSELELVSKKKPKSISGFIKKWEKEYARAS